MSALVEVSDQTVQMELPTEQFTSTRTIVRLFRLWNAPTRELSIGERVFQIAESLARMNAAGEFDDLPDDLIRELDRMQSDILDISSDYEFERSAQRTTVWMRINNWLAYWGI